ncbi:MAG: 3-hydroxyacyl-CoA dehydrogenase NAD-binding domain-containing protein [Pseudomonadota bacterium]
MSVVRIAVDPAAEASANGAVALVTIANPPVNALSAAVRAGLLEAIQTLSADPAVRAIVITGEGKTFVAGADISEFGKPAAPPALPDLLAAIEACAKPIVAAVNGVALGGGLELALACHGRVVAPGARLGLPEIKLGLIPGAGGTQRLPRILGAAAAFPMMLSGEPVDAGEAVALGLADALAQGDLIAAAKAHALALAEAGAPPKVRDRADRFTSEDRAAFEAAAAEALKKSPGMPNVVALVDAVRAALDLPFDEALALERARFKALIDDPRSKAARHLFFAERAAARIPGVGKEVKARAIAKAAIIGAGTMGGGIAMCFAQAGIPVTLIEVKEEAITAGLARIRANYQTSVKRGSLSAEAMERHLSFISGAVGLEAAGDADIIVEAAFEDMGVKAEIFGTLDKVAKPGAILATNTSYLDVDAIAATTSRPQDVVGLHFFSPANVMRLLEVVRGAATAPDVLVTSLDLGRRLGKLPVVVGVCYGFVGNRMLAKRSQAGERVLLAGALPHEVDAAVTAFGFRMGPFAMLDLAGLDIGWRARKVSGVKAPVGDALCEQGRFGQKTGRGFYLYPEGARKGERDGDVEALIAALSAERGISRRSFTADEIIARLMYPMVNEGAKILEEGIAARASDIDVVWVNGYNWPAFTGGPMHWAEGEGLAKIVAALEAFAAETGDESLRPAPLLKRLADSGGSFASVERA